MYPNPMLQQQMAQLDQEYAQKKANLMQSLYAQQQSSNWGQQNVSAQTPAPSQNVDWVYVAGVEGARNQIVQPDCKVWMMDNNDPYIYVKSVDKFGSPEFHAFFIQEVPESELNQQNKPALQTQIDLSQYVQRAEFDALKAQLEEYTSMQPKRQQKANKGVEDNG